jgi:hypothetical protein
MTEPTKPAVEATKTAAPTAPVVAKVDKAEKAAPAYTMVRAVYGDMHDVTTGLSYGMAPCELLKPSGWVDMQIEAGKMVVVE